jgi:NADPH-dependent 2,4-dienoyl-CoA reductase/sulfur reductase-like enzyme
VWRIEADGTVYFTGEHAAGSLAARNVLIATGAVERPMPIRGWTLPGVLSCGGAQILFMSADLVPAGRVFLAGSGPLLFLYAAQLLRAGVTLQGILETTPVANYVRAAARIVHALPAREDLVKGLRMMREIRRAGVPILRGVEDVCARGEMRLEAVAYHRHGREHREPADTLLLHQGVVPHVNLPFSTGCDKTWDSLQRCFRPVVSDIGETSVPNIFVAGDGAGIGGAIAAEHSGTLCAIAIAERLGRIAPAESMRESARVRTERTRHLRLRPFLDTLYRPTQKQVAPPDPATIACRCEEVTVGDVRRLAAQGCVGPNQMKAFVRCGMGPCQGRLCGLTIVELIAETRNVAAGEVGYYRLRSPVKPIMLGELAGLPLSPTRTNT